MLHIDVKMPAIGQTLILRFNSDNKIAELPLGVALLFVRYNAAVVGIIENGEFIKVPQDA